MVVFLFKKNDGVKEELGYSNQRTDDPGSMKDTESWVKDGPPQDVINKTMQVLPSSFDPETSRIWKTITFNTKQRH